VILGYLLVVSLSRVADGFAAPPGQYGSSGWRARFTEGDEDEGLESAGQPRLRLVPRGPMTAEHDGERRAA
jgi:hypothetical protein